MASTTETAGELRLKPRAPRREEATGQDRARQMRRARIHTVLVRMLRLALPVAAIGVVGSFVLSVYIALPSGKGISVGSVQISTESLTMQNPRYEGFAKDGGRFVVTARTAVQDFKQTKPVELEGITGNLVQPDKTVTTIAAAQGLFDTKTNELEMFGGIDVASETGLKARMSRATVNTKESRIVSREPVLVTMPSGTIRSRQMELEQKTRRIAFIEAVETRLTPEARPALKGSDAGAAPTPARPQGFGRTDAPVDVQSARLDVDDAAKTALFTGGVRAIQGDAVLETESLEVQYESGPAEPGAAPPASAAPGGGGGKVKRILSPVPVVLTQGSDRATGDVADFDTLAERARLAGNVVMTSGTDRRATSDVAEIDGKADTILLTGKVHVQQARNELKGRRLAVDRKAGRSRLTSPAEAGTPAGRISARFYSAEAGKPAGPAGAAKTDKATAAPEGPVPGLGVASFRTDPDAPVDVEADTLDVDDTAHSAVFRGDVRANQGEFRIRTSEMTAFYSGAAGLATPAPGSPQATQKQAAAQLTRVEARKKVVVTSKDGQTATGDWADFDVKANTVTLGGDVVLTQGKNIVRGTRLLIDLTSGESRILTGSERDPAGAKAPATKGDAPPPQGPFVGGDVRRPSMVLYPNKAKEAAKEAVKAVPEETVKQATSAAKSAAEQLKGAAPKAVRKRLEQAGAGGWDITSGSPGSADAN